MKSWKYTLPQTMADFRVFSHTHMKRFQIFLDPKRYFTFKNGILSASSDIVIHSYLTHPTLFFPSLYSSRVFTSCIVYPLHSLQGKDLDDRQHRNSHSRAHLCRWCFERQGQRKERRSVYATEEGKPPNLPTRVGPNRTVTRQAWPRRPARQDKSDALKPPASGMTVFR